MRSPKGLLHEQGFNYQLGQALRDANARWREDDAYVAVERRKGIRKSLKRPDIQIDDPRAPAVAIECAYGGDNDKDALARVEDGSFGTAIAVNVPKSFEGMSENQACDKLRDGATVGYAVLQRDPDEQIFRFPQSGYIAGTARDLAAMIPMASLAKTDVENVADEVAECIDTAANALASGLSEQDCKRIAKEVFQRTKLTAFRTVQVLWLDALLTQMHLRKQGHNFGRLPIGNTRPIELAETWQKILEVNWNSIFAPAVNVLRDAASIAPRETGQAIDHLVKAVDAIETARLGTLVNVGAELFPKISVDRKEAAAFYTMPATAELLSMLTIRETDKHEWSATDLFKHLHVGDLACGTGTLLRAAYRRIKGFHEAHGGNSDTLMKFHANAMEGGVIGADVSPIAAHLTASSLAAIGHGKPYRKTSIGWVDVGSPIKGKKQQGTTGSIELIAEDGIPDLLDSLCGVAGGDKTEEQTIIVRDNALDYILMNPPYSQTHGKASAFDIAGLTDYQRKSCQRRWSSLLRDKDATKRGGMAASFLVVAREKIKPGGRIGFVLPLSAGFVEGWRKTRKMILRDFENIVAITRAGKLNAEALSADTGMAEMLLIATRKQVDNESISPIHCVSLRRVPKRTGEAGEVGKSILSTIDTMHGKSQPVTIGNEEIGQISLLDVSPGEPWSHLGVLHEDLAVAAMQIANGGILMDLDSGQEMRFSCGMSTLSEEFSVGPGGDLVGRVEGSKKLRGAFLLHPITRRADVRGTDRSLYIASAKEQNRLIVEPTHKGTAWDNNDSLRRQIRSQRGTLHYAQGLQWTSQSLLAASTNFPVMGGRAWLTLIHENEKVLKAFALWANSTFGLLTHWTRGDRTQSGRAGTPVTAIKNMPCLGFRKLGENNINRVAAAFDSLTQLELRPACQAHVDQTRHKIDEEVIALLGLPKRRAQKAIRVLRNLWCAEPTVHGNNQKALELLEECGLIDSLT